MNEVQLEGEVHDMGWGPPACDVACPRCGTSVDTRHSYPAFDGFPLGMQELQQAYAGFTPNWEGRPATLEDGLHGLGTSTDVEAHLNTDGGREWFRQRVFYRSAKSFYRSLQLLLASLHLEANCFVTWSEVTGYYTRFYFVQAFLNLLLSSWHQQDQWFVYAAHDRLRCVHRNQLGPACQARGSHEIWWRLFEAIKLPDYPVDALGFILSKLQYNPAQRNNINYRFDYLGGGFIELDWFDSGAQQMMAHFTPIPSRYDQDFTNMDRFFAGTPAEDADVGDFYGDPVQILWCSVRGYLQLVRALGIQQGLVATETIVALAEVHLHGEFPSILEGIARSAAEILQDGFDVDAFLEGRMRNPQRRSSFVLPSEDRSS
jgi:hypothetical protein